MYLGAFNTDDKVLAIFKNGTYYTTSFDLSNRYQGEILRIEKFDPGKTFTALYYDADPKVKSFYVKRFSFALSDNTPVLFIAQGRNSYLVDLSDERHPRFRVVFGGRNEGRNPEDYEAEEFIAKKGVAAKGKRVHSLEVGSVSFIEPLPHPEDEVPEEEEAAAEPENLADEIDSSEEIIDIEIPEGNIPDEKFASLQGSGNEEFVIEEPTLF